MNLILDIKSAYDCLKDHQEPFGAAIENDTIYIPPSKGKGYIQAFQLGEGVSILLYDFQLKESLIVKAEVQKNNDYYSSLINISSNVININVEEEERKFSRHGSTGLFIYSPGSHAGAFFNANERFILLFISFSRQYILSLVSNSKIRALLSPENKFIYFQDIDIYLENSIKQIFENRDADLKKIQLLGQCLLLIEHILSNAIASSQHNIVGLLQDDISNLFKARELLTTRYEKPPTITELSSVIGMNETKLKKSFKQIFKISIYQYAQYTRMLKAKELLESRKYNASEVAYLVGYANLTHFGEAFKKHFDILPGQYLNSVLQSFTQIG